MRAKQFGQLRRVGIGQGLWFGQAGDLDVDQIHLAWTHLGEAVILRGSLGGTLAHVFGKRLVRLKGADAAAQLPAYSQGHKTRPSFQ